MALRRRTLGRYRHPEAEAVPWDAGLQPERTTLSWIRTALTLMVVSMLTARLAWESGLLAVGFALSGTVAAVGLVFLQSHRHYHRDRLLKDGVTVEPALAAILGLTFLLVIFALTSLLLVVLPLLAG
jgi:uncharacterized membrane protein YidH (DUF202 family)